MKKHFIAATSALLLFTAATMLPSCGDDDEPTTCDTANVSYKDDVAPIITTHCSDAECHGGASPGSGFRMDGYDNLLLAVGAGRIVGAINHQAGFSAMPKDKPKLDDCDISLIESWIAQGAQNN